MADLFDYHEEVNYANFLHNTQTDKFDVRTDRPTDVHANRNIMHYFHGNYLHVGTVIIMPSEAYQ